MNSIHVDLNFCLKFFAKTDLLQQGLFEDVKMKFLYSRDVFENMRMLAEIDHFFISFHFFFNYLATFYRSVYEDFLTGGRAFTVAFTVGCTVKA